MRRGRQGWDLAVALGTLAVAATLLVAATPPLRVCADPNNLPFSNRQEEGFENRIAALVTSDLGRPLRCPSGGVTCAAPSERVSATCCSACRRTSRRSFPRGPTIGPPTCS